MLSEEKRGPILEAVVSRMKIVQEVLETSLRCHDSVRFVAVSATLPNIEDVAHWLSEAQHFSMGEEFRPVKLRKIVVGYPCPKSYSAFRFEITLSFKLRPLLFKYADGKPTLIFCSTRKGVMQTAVTLCQQITFRFGTQQGEHVLRAVATVKEGRLRDCLAAGVGFHHAGMDIEDRHVVENLFRGSHLPVLVSTSTLALGVNLPAHLVIIKSTQYYFGGTYIDYSDSQLLQMIGRAGRPQFDSEATAVIMTRESQQAHYDKLVRGEDTVESNLHRHLAEHINSEVVLGTITETSVAINWIRSTFLYIRALRCPQYYGMSAGLSAKGVENKLQEMCLRELNALASVKLVTLGIFDVCPTYTGRLMANYYMGFESMKTFTTVTGKENLYDILLIIAGCYEFSGFQLRASDKKMLNTLNKGGLRFPFKGLIRTTTMKISCLIQAAFGCHSVQDSSLYQEMLRILRIGERATKCLAKCLQLQPHHQSLLSAIILTKCFHCKLWENSPYVSRQLERIGPVLSELLVAAGKTSFREIATSNPRDLERILNRTPPMGNKLREAAGHVPQFQVKLQVMKENSLLQIKIHVSLGNSEQIKQKSTTGVHFVHLIAGTQDNKLLLWKRFKDDTLLNGHTWTSDIPPGCKEVIVDLVSESWVGLDVKETLVLQQPSNLLTIGGEICFKKENIGNKTIEAKKSGKDVAEYTKHASIGTVSQFGHKKLCMNTPKSAFKINLEKFLYTPKSKKKIAQKGAEVSSKLFSYPDVNATENGSGEYVPQSSVLDIIPQKTMNHLGVILEKTMQKECILNKEEERTEFAVSLNGNKSLINENNFIRTKLQDKTHSVQITSSPKEYRSSMPHFRREIGNYFKVSLNNDGTISKMTQPTDVNTTTTVKERSYTNNLNTYKIIDSDVENGFLMEPNAEHIKHLMHNNTNTCQSQITFDLGISNLLDNLLNTHTEDRHTEKQEKQEYSMKCNPLSITPRTTKSCGKVRRSINRKEIIDILNLYSQKQPYNSQAPENKIRLPVTNSDCNILMNLTQLEEEDKNNFSFCQKILSKSNVTTRNSPNEHEKSLAASERNDFYNNTQKMYDLRKMQESQDFIGSQKITTSPYIERNISSFKFYKKMKINDQSDIINQESQVIHSSELKNDTMNFFFDFSDSNNISHIDSTNKFDSPLSSPPLSNHSEVGTTLEEDIYLSTSSMDIDFEQLD